MPYTHLSEHDRYIISHMRSAGFKPSQIARRLGRDRGTIGRELQRNVDHHGDYHYLPAHRISTARRTAASCRYKLDQDTPLSRTVREGLRQRWSPEQIVGRLQRTHRHAPSMRISHEAIYQWIYRRSRFGECWHEQLRRGRPRRRARSVGQRGQIRNRVGIEHRPAIVDHRRRFGDWEADTMEGAKGTGVLLTCVERKSRYTRAGKLADKRAQPLAQRGTTLLGDLPASLRRTMTVDNGKEFADFATLQRKLEMPVYFADPHSPWQRGTNENTNGLLRDFFPKGCDFGRVTHHQVAKAVRMLNNRPRKCLNYQTPAEVLSRFFPVALRI
jgi:IS30 family transposase